MRFCNTLGKNMHDMHSLWQYIIITQLPFIINNRRLWKKILISTRCSEKHKYLHMSAHFSKKSTKFSLLLFPFLVFWTCFFDRIFLILIRDLLLVPLISTTRDWLYSFICSQPASWYLFPYYSIYQEAGWCNGKRSANFVVRKISVYKYSQLLSS